MIDEKGELSRLSKVGAPYGSIRAVAVAARTDNRHGEPISHAAMLYRAKSEVRVFELQSHQALSDAPVAQNDFVWVEPAIPVERLRLVVARAKLVHKSHQQNAVPYGFRYRVSTFDFNGACKIGQGEIGFTCSTIIAAIFDAERVPLLDPTSWPPPDEADKKARRAFIGRLPPKYLDHGKALAREIDSPRISPEEAVAAAAGQPRVGTFESVQSLAAAVRLRIGAQ